MTASDGDLLREYVLDGSNPAFAELVRRHLNLVYSAARRQVRSAALAEDIAQSVFLDQSRNAAKLQPGQPLIAWLYLVTRRTAIDVIRQESRRQFREQTALEIAAMKSTSSPWDQVEPLLDEALETLNATDRHALLLRYFANKSLRDVGETLGTSEDAAQKRVGRAIEQLRTVFARRGITITAAGLAADLSAQAMPPAPASLGAAISANAIPAVVTPSVAFLQTSNYATMTALNKTLIATALILTTGLVYEARLLSKQQSDLRALRQESGSLRTQLRLMTEAGERANQNLASVQQQLDVARTQVLKFQTRIDPAMESELEAWLNRVDQLKQSLGQMPEKNIPELKFLDSNDWLSVTLDNKLETDAEIRKALSSLRNLAKTKPQVAPNISKALEAYMKANHDQPPSNVLQLEPYLNPGLDEAILTRYELTPAASSAGWRGSKRLLQEKNPVDEYYDNQLFFMEKGGFGIQGVNKVGDALGQAISAFAKANNGRSPVTMEEVLPFLTIPMDQAKLKEYWQAYTKNGIN